MLGRLTSRIQYVSLQLILLDTGQGSDQVCHLDPTVPFSKSKPGGRWIDWVCKSQVWKKWFKIETSWLEICRQVLAGRLSCVGSLSLSSLILEMSYFHTESRPHLTASTKLYSDVGGVRSEVVVVRSVTLRAVLIFSIFIDESILIGGHKTGVTILSIGRNEVAPKFLGNFKI